MTTLPFRRLGATVAIRPMWWAPERRSAFDINRSKAICSGPPSSSHSNSEEDLGRPVGLPLGPALFSDDVIRSRCGRYAKSIAYGTAAGVFSLTTTVSDCVGIQREARVSQRSESRRVGKEGV